MLSIDQEVSCSILDPAVGFLSNGELFLDMDGLGIYVFVSILSLLVDNNCHLYLSNLARVSL